MRTDEPGNFVWGVYVEIFLILILIPFVPLFLVYRYIKYGFNKRKFLKEVI